ncbi:hypothetical protein [Chitinophaga filiformis]|uniref:Uncharacterized protein n=1 Tax=Chitinophaga filiformis TaxID=104663 RepID=A0A1G7SLQ5_CHIFI|nr:hypothetical protein [Chitinophaga filiformis]SDG23784.1 hypothetical protein SAMN04488121_103919 [Chitinophaga filiformis]
MKKHIVFNKDLETFGHQHILGTARPPAGQIRQQEYDRLKALLFEQFLLFDKIAVKTDRWSAGLRVLYSILGINKFQELIEKDIIVPVLWAPQLVTSTGMQLEDGSIDHDAVLGKPPLVSGSMSPEDSDPEMNIETLFKYFPDVHKDRKRILLRRMRDKFVIPDKVLANQSASIVINAYKNNNLAIFGLPSNKEPEQLDYLERGKLLDLGYDVLETSVLAKQDYKSYDKYSYFNLTKDSLRKIESAFHVSENTSQILSIQNVTAIQKLVLEEKIPFDRVFDIRYHSVIKEYRKWINSTSESTDAAHISQEYIDAIKGKNKFFESTAGKFLKNIVMLGVGSGVGIAANEATEYINNTLAAGAIGAAGAGIIGKAADFGLSLLDTYVLDGILKGWNPSMFVDKIKYESEPPATLDAP